MVETPYAMLHAEEIAAASDRLTVLVMGTNDLVKELYAEHVPGRQPVLAGLSLALLAARATGKAILDGVYNDVKDTEGFLAECTQGRQMGFDGKTLIHPGQVEGANEAFAPSAQAVEDARGILEAWEGRTSHVVTYNGRLIEAPPRRVGRAHAVHPRGDPGAAGLIRVAGVGGHDTTTSPSSTTAGSSPTATGTLAVVRRAGGRERPWPPPWRWSAPTSRSRPTARLADGRRVHFVGSRGPAALAGGWWHPREWPTP